jgi:hypothetical protein
MVGMDQASPQVAGPQKSLSLHRRYSAAAYANTETADDTTQARCDYLPMVMADVDTATTISSVPEQYSHDDGEDGVDDDDDDDDEGVVPIAPELAPEEIDLEARVAERLNVEMKERLDQVLTERLQAERTSVVLVAVEKKCVACLAKSFWLWYALHCW